MGTQLGNLFAVILVIGAALMGLVSLKASAISFATIAYGFWALIAFANFYVGRSINETFRKGLSDGELRAFRQYRVYIIAPASGEAFSALLNFLRVCGFVWAGLCAWHGYYIFAGLLGAFYFVSGGTILKTNPSLYMGRQALAGNAAARSELAAIESLKEKRGYYLDDVC